MSTTQIKKGSDLPLMPSGEGKSGLVMLIGYRMDTGESIHYPMSEFIRALEAGEYVPALAESLRTDNASGVRYVQTRSIETTGGGQSIDSSKKAYVTSVRGTEAGIAASGAKIVSVGFNQIPPSGISGQTATFNAVACAWGEYGKSTKNNGYLFTDADGTIVVPTSVLQNSVAVPTHTENNVVYYLPSADGNVVATFASSVDVSEICAHICWSNYRDTEYAEYSAEEIDLSSVITAAGGTLRRVSNSAGKVYDEIVLSTTTAERLWYRRVGVIAALANENWSVETVTSGEGVNATTQYRFSLAITGMKSNGIFAVSGGSVTGFYVSGTNLIVDSDSITTVSAFKTALASASLKYELATAVTGSHSLTGEITIDDFGVIRFDGGASTVEFETKYTSYWRDVLKNMTDTIDEEGVVTASAIASLTQRIAAIEESLSNGLSELAVEKLTVRRSMNGTPNDGNWVLRGTSSPTVIPEFVGQMYLDTTNKKHYTAYGVSAVGDWVLDN